MKYPITPDYLDSVPDPLVDLYTDLEEKILKDICRRFKMSGEATESAIAQMKLLQERGVSLDDIEKFVRETLNLSEKELDEIIDRAVDRNRQYYDRLIEKADILNAEFRGLDREIAAIRRQTHDELFNLTQSMGFAIRTGREVEFLPVAKTYQKVLDDASTQVLSGAVDYNTAIREAVKRLTDSGLQTIDYASGWHNRVDVAVRRAVMTGVSQLSSQYAEQAAEELETDLREVTAHSGARDTGTGWQNHKNWQGKVYSVKTGGKYPSIYEVCGWGMVDGLEGANCRHHHYPFLEGVSERTYTDEQLANIDPPPFEYQGKKYTAYEATQKQRQIERAMRKCKREFIGYEAAGQTESAQDSAIRLRRLSQEYKAFSKAAGLRTQPERARVDGFGQKWNGNGGDSFKEKSRQIAKEASKNMYDETAVSPYVKTAQYRQLFGNLDESKKVQRIAYKKAKSMLTHRSGTKFEDLIFIDTKTGKYLSRTDYNVENEVLPSNKMKAMVRNSEPYTIVAIHNHSGNTVPSMADLHTAYKNKYKYGLIACHNGTLMRYEVTGEYNSLIVDSLLDRVNKALYNGVATNEAALDNLLSQLREENVVLEVFRQ